MSCLAKLGRRDIVDALTLYEALHLPRTGRVQAASANNKTRFHLPDGLEQVARDEEMAKGTTDWSMQSGPCSTATMPRKRQRTHDECQRASVKRGRCAGRSGWCNGVTSPEA